MSVAHVVLKAVPGTGERVTFEFARAHRTAAMEAAVTQRVPISVVVKHANRNAVHVHNFTLAFLNIVRTRDGDDFRFLHGGRGM